MMERRTLMSGSDLTWILPHWLSCLLWEVKWSSLCMRVIEWVNFMNENSSSRAVDRRWDHLIEWRIPPLDLLSYTRQPRLAPVLMNPINVHYRQKYVVVVTWMMAIQSNISFPQWSEQSSIYHLKHGAARNKDMKVVNCQSLPMILSLLYISIRLILSWISWSATYLTVKVTKSNASGP